jgi:hypothetical protein
MELNISKCKAMHVDKKNPGITYTMNSYSDNLTRTLKILLIFKTKAIAFVLKIGFEDSVDFSRFWHLILT